MKIKRLFLAVILFCFFSPLSFADILPAKIFSDHMVLQRDQVVSIWGWSSPKSKIELTFNQQNYFAISDAFGKWKITLAAQPASGPFNLQFNGDGTIQINDVYFGDVWLAGGQSNMEWKLNWKINNSDNIIASANYPLIRFFDVPSKTSHTPEQDLTSGNWLQATPQNAGNFSAIAYLFALQNHIDKGVAVGIVDDNWGGTPAEAWVTKESLATLPQYKPAVDETYNRNIDWPTTIAKNKTLGEIAYKRLVDQDLALAADAYRFDFPTTNWESIVLPPRTAFSDLAWLRLPLKLNITIDQDAILELGKVQQEAFVFVNEQLVENEKGSLSKSRYVIPKGLLKKGDNLIAIRVGNSWDNHPSVGKQGQMYLQANDQKIPLDTPWLYSNTVEPPINHQKRLEWTPGFLYNAMIHPIAGYGMRGVIWYQGESNVGEAAYYGDLFTTLIEDWRHQWNADFSFIFVQLAAFLKPQNPQSDSSWARLREMQTRALKLPNTGMATAIDIGDINDIHPRNKQDVANRLWGEAKRIHFNDKHISRGPIYQSHKTKKNTVTIYFKNADKLHLNNGDFVKGFILADKDGVFYPANGKINNNKVVVWSDAVKKPVSLKYAWADYPVVNLVNSAELPAEPFAIDSL